ncbi:MAG TPA: hypothetical protein PKK95_07015 [Vicinamibacterales bacterium]|nr:hypothetical protein [Vicinamibacterales bacterium]
MRTRLTALLLAAWLGSAVLSAQTPAGARPADVETPETIVAALYDVISGPAGQARDWDRFRHLFAPGARLMPVAPRKDGSAPAALSPDDYVERTREAFLKNGFFEKEIARKAEAFGNVAHVFSTYETRRAAGDAKPMARGINSIQLMKHAGRWWILTVAWDQEREGNPLPEK